MISKAQKNKIIKVLGSRFSTPIKAELELMNITNRNGKPHSSSMISQVMNGMANDDIERAIFSAVKKKNEELKDRDKLLNQLEY